jgi:uncharacterized membrane protein YgcG
MRFLHIGAAVTLAFSTAAPTAAQTVTDTDSRWDAWLGCWQLVEERVREEWDPEDSGRELVPAKGAVVCVTAADAPNAVRLTTRVESQSSLEDTIVADGTPRPLREPGCEGTQRTEWSSNGRRLFARAELTCGGTQRIVSGMTMIDATRLWTDVQVVEEGRPLDSARGRPLDSARGRRETIRVRRYRRAPDQIDATASLPKPEQARALGTMARQAATLTMDEVKEVAQKLPVSGLEAVLLETGASFPLNGKRLVELDEAGVPDRIIDLMVALSFPDRFVIERRASSGGLAPSGWGFAYGSPYDWPYYYAPFGYSAFGRYDTYYYGAPGYVVVDVAPVGPQPSGQGRVVDGLGYTRVRAREPQTVAGAGGSGAGSTGSSSGGTVSSGGYSGGGGGDGGRTAVSRPPG